jgi:predicted nucleotidyltransferase
LHVVFSVESREAVRGRLLERAREDERIVSAAITGSAARGAEDEWSDVDLAFGVAEGASVADVLAEWTAWLSDELDVVHHWDLVGGGWTYRVFGSRGSAFRLVFGDAVERDPGPPEEARYLIGLAWHHALHARSALGRGRPWLAEWLVSALRDHVLELACLRLGLSTHFGRGFDALPPEVAAQVAGALVRSLEPSELRRALDVATSALVDEVREHDAELAGRLGATLRS